MTNLLTISAAYQVLLVAILVNYIHKTTARGTVTYSSTTLRGEVKGIEVWRKSSKSAVKWSEVKCSDVRWNGAVGNINGVKLNEKVVKFKWKEVKCRRVEWSVGGWSVVGWSVVKVLVTGCLTFIIFFRILLAPFFVFVHMVVCSECFCLIL